MRAGRTLLLATLALAASCAMPREDGRPRSGTTQQAIGWNGGAVDPIRIRTGHSATLLGTNEVLLAGGGSAPKTTELVSIFDGKSVAGPDLAQARVGHTGTMLLSGKVLIAGGNDGGKALASAELFDPIARTSTATGSMAHARAGQAAIRLHSGKVLVTGGSGDVTTEIYDPSTATWSAGPDRVGDKALSALVTLEDGRILAVSEADPTTEILSADGTAWAAAPASVPQTGGVQTLTRLADGRIACGYEAGCVSNGSTTSCFSNTSVIGKLVGGVVDGPKFAQGRAAFTAVRTVEGNVLFLGGEPAPDVRRVEQLDNLAATDLTNEGTLLAAHGSPSATLLPGGDILVSGGTQAALDRRVSPGAWRPNAFTLLHRREKHMSVRLHDGTVLVAGGDAKDLATGSTIPAAVLAAEIIDAAGAKSTEAGDLAASHIFGTMTTLRDGKVLIVGGGTEKAEVFTPGTGSTITASMSVTRTGHTATLLPSGRVLVIGGTGTLTASEIFDPATSTWKDGATPTNAWTNHGAVLLPNGLVLVVGGGAAEIYDETKNAFRATTSPGATRDGQTAQLLANGRVFVAGGSTLAAELFDPLTETWSFTIAQTEQAVQRTWTALPSGRLVVTGGHQPIEQAIAAQRIFDPLAHPTGSFLDLPTAPHVGYNHSTALAGTGEAVFSGGQPCYFLCVASSLDAVSVYGDGALAAYRPTITDVAATVTAGTKVQITGTGFANGPEASSGTRSASAVNHPTAVWLSDAGDAVVPSTLLDFTDTTATWLVPTTALYGHGQLFVNVAGVMSVGKSVTITPALAATTCANDAQCKTGFCTDGVCCDRRCDGLCEACTKARKTTGDDGVCGAVPPGVGRCILKLGDACNGGNECGTGFCAQGVCCDSTCDGQCLSCNLQGKAGRCSAVNEGACGAACDGDHTLKQVGVDDVNCAPYKCSGPQCSQACASAHDCVAPAICSFDGHCVPPVAPPAGTDSVCGCRAVGARSNGDAQWLLFGTALALLLARRRGPRSGPQQRREAPESSRARVWGGGVGGGAPDGGGPRSGPQQRREAPESSRARVWGGGVGGGAPDGGTRR